MLIVIFLLLEDQSFTRKTLKRNARNESIEVVKSKQFIINCLVI